MAINHRHRREQIIEMTIEQAVGENLNGFFDQVSRLSENFPGNETKAKLKILEMISIACDNFYIRKKISIEHGKSNSHGTD